MLKKTTNVSQNKYVSSLSRKKPQNGIALNKILFFTCLETILMGAVVVVNVW